MSRLIQLPKRLFTQASTIRNIGTMRPLTHTNNNLMLSVMPVKPLYDELGDIKKNGIIVVQLMPCVKEPGTDKMTVISHKKLKFVFTVSNIGYVLLLEDHCLSKERININLEYVSRAGTKKSLKLHKLPTEEQARIEIENTLEEVAQPFKAGVGYTKRGTNYLGKYDMRISKGYLLAVREMARYSLPFLVGWQQIKQASLQKEQYSMSQQPH